MNIENVSNRWDDVVFENRNKEYGAYTIRHAYDRNLSKASTVSFLFLGFLVAVAQMAMMIRPEIENKIVDPPLQFVFNDMKIIPDKVQPKEIVKPKLNQDQVPTKVVTHEVKPIKTKPIETGTTSSSVDGQGSDVPIPSEGIGTETPVVTAVVAPQVFDHAEVMPEFEGGLKALYKFLGKNLRYPIAAKNQGQEGTVLVRFVVDFTGAVTNIEIIRSVSGSLDKEAARVISLLPKWKPGKQHDSPVNVRMVVPIKFTLDE